ncbi:uncharacterized protein E6C27_scaffold418G00440 [Cucumis melo var. makuwa]|uniref:Retrotransposon gag domain-containing protein n=1 Tax=Cucumis melo var. makuwa TaxID=1194695 RepID=A0A5A7VGL4_CUCMM|nr:uncharacterized protein E6C27_scaffold418G00440 [Cucumis melo var. makuwa]
MTREHSTCFYEVTFGVGCDKWGSEHKNHGTTRGRQRQVRQVAVDVLATGSVNRAQASDEVSSNPHFLVGRRTEENMSDHPPKSIDRLKALRATIFVGTTNPADAEKWLNGTEDWWTLNVTRIGGEGLIMWEDFRKAFKDKFYPRSFCDTKRNEFMNLIQGDMTVANYEK